MYKVDATGMQLLLGYSDVFGAPSPNLIEEIGKMNMHKTLSIISELIRVRNTKLDPIRIFNCEISVPLEMAIKKEILDIDEAMVDGFPTNPLFRKDCHIISLQMLLIFLKKVLIYGNYSTLVKTDYAITKEDYAQVIRLQLVVADEVTEKNKLEFDKGHFLYSTYHLNGQPSVFGRVLRMYYMLEHLCKDKSNFAYDVQGEYRDYNTVFVNRYGITIAQYIAFLFWELEPYYSEKNRLSFFTSWRNIETTYQNKASRDLLLKTLSSLSSLPQDLHEWAAQTENEEWNFEEFLKTPFLFDNEGNYLSISEYTLSNAFFEKLYWLIRDCYPCEDKGAMAFYGRLHERYIQELTEEAAKKTSYIYIGEFAIGKPGHESKSSDAYLQKGSKLLAVEAKGFSVLKNVMASNKDVEKNNRKVFICPILEADGFAYKATKDGERFSAVEEIYVVAVSMDSINANPYYYEEIVREIERKKLCSRVYYYFNFNIEEYEMLMSIVEMGIDIFSLLQGYFKETVLPPFSNYLRQKGLKPQMTAFMREWYKRATVEITDILRSNEEKQGGD